jgi:hypothetical protein
MSKVESVAEGWTSYLKHVVPKNASSTQIEETRRAFYAGSYFSLMNVMYNVGDEQASEEEGIENLERLKAECETFAINVGQPLPTPVLQPPDINYTEPDPLDIQRTMKGLGTKIGEALPDGWGFNLLIFTYGEGGSLFYISSAQRSDVINVMKEFIKRQTQ